MRIVLDITPLLGRRTGIGRYVDELVRALPQAATRRGMDVTFAGTTWTARGGRVHDLPTGIRQVGPRVPARALRAAWTRTDHPRIETLVGRCDVFHATNFVSPPTRRAREVVTVHDLTYEHHQETVSADSLAYGHLVRRALARGAHVVTPSAAVAQEVVEHYALDPERVTPTRLGVDGPWLTASPLEAADLVRRGLPERYLVFVGSLDPRKNLPRLLEAHARARAEDRDVPDLVLAGPAGREAGLQGRDGVHLTGWLDDDTLRGVVAGAQALVLPSLDEGFGLPALEALAAGRPVLAADIPALREVTGGHAVLAPPLSIDAIASGIVDVVNAADDADARSRRRAWASGWTWAACADSTLEAYLREH